MDELILRPEGSEDAGAVEALFDRVFGRTRYSLSSYRLREGVPPVAELCRVACGLDGLILGAIRFWPIRVGDEGIPALLTGPVGVHPTRQGEGLGGALLRAGLNRARRLGMPPEAVESGSWKRVVLVGDEPYYRRFGFRRALAAFLEFPAPTDPSRVLALELEPGAMQGVSGAVEPWDAAGANLRRRHAGRLPKPGHGGSVGVDGAGAGE